MEKKEMLSFRNSMVKVQNDYGQEVIRIYLSPSLKEKLINASDNLKEIVFTFLSDATLISCAEHITDLKDKQDAMLGKVGAFRMWGRKHFGGNRGMYKLLQHKIRLLEALIRSINRIRDLKELLVFLKSKEALFNEIGDLFIRRLQEKMLSSSADQNTIYDIPIKSLPKDVQKQIAQTNFLEITSLERIEFLSKIFSYFVITH